MVEGTVFVGAAIVALTELYKHLRDKAYDQAFVVLIAAAVGLVVALVDTSIGVADITVAQGILLGLSASGVVAIAKKV